VGAFRYIPSGDGHTYEVLFKEPVPHDPKGPYPLSRIVIKPAENGVEVHVHGPKNAQRQVAYLLQTVAKAYERMHR
jgi:hypothetical protein